MRQIIDTDGRAATARGASLALHLMDLAWSITATQMAEHGHQVPARILDAPAPQHDDDEPEDPYRSPERLVARVSDHFPSKSYAVDPQLVRWTERAEEAWRFADVWAAHDAIRAACSPSGEFDDYLAKYLATTRIDGSRL